MAYTGITTTIPCAEGGFNGNRNKSIIPPTDMISGTKNLNIHEGVRRKRGGTAHISSEIESGARLWGMYDYLKPAGTQFIVFATSGKVYKNATTTIKTGWTASKHVWFSQFDGELYVCNGANSPGKWDGTTWTDLTDIPSDWTGSNFPKYMITHGRGNSIRNWAISCPSTPYSVYASPNGDGDDFSDANVTQLSIDTEDGYGIVGGQVYLDQLIMFGKKRSYIIDDADTNTTNWGYNQAAWEGGVAHQRLIIPTPNDIVCVDENMEIYSVTAAQQYGDYEQASIARPAFLHNWIDDNVRKSYIADFHGVYDRALRAIKIFVVRNGQTEIDTALVYFIDRGPKAGWMIHDNLISASGYDASCSAEIYVGAGNYQVYTGDYSGYIWGLETSARHDNSNLYLAGFKTTDMDMNNPRVKKNFRRGWVICDPQGAETINIKVWIDETQIDNPGGEWADTTAYVVGDIVINDAVIYQCIADHTSAQANDEPGIGTNWADYWVQHRFSHTVASGTKNYAFDIGEVGARIKLEVYNGTASEDMILEEVMIDFKLLGSKPA